MMAGAGEFDTVADQCRQVKLSTRPELFMSGLAGFEHLLDGAQQAIGVVDHEAVEIRALGFVHLAALQSLQVETDGSDGGFKFVSDGVDETVMLLVAADFTNQEAGVQDDAGGDGGEENEGQKNLNIGAPVQNNPSATDSDGDPGQDDAQGEEEEDRFAATSDAHPRKFYTREEASLKTKAGGVKISSAKAQTRTRKRNVKDST